MISVKCTVKQALQILNQIDKDASIILTINDLETLKHKQPERISLEVGVNMVAKATSLDYQDNDFFGRLSLRGVTNNRNIIHNLLFPS